MLRKTRRTKFSNAKRRCRVKISKAKEDGVEITNAQED